jgi:hypothetical protein
MISCVGRSKYVQLFYNAKTVPLPPIWLVKPLQSRPNIGYGAFLHRDNNKGSCYRRYGFCRFAYSKSFNRCRGSGGSSGALKKLGNSYVY